MSGVAVCVELPARAARQHQVVQHRRRDGPVRQPRLLQHQLAEHRTLRAALRDTQRIHRST